MARQVGSTWAMSWLFTVICFVAGQHIVFFVFAALGLIFLGILYYKNYLVCYCQTTVAKTNVVMILVLILCNWSIDIARSADTLSPINGFLYMLAVFAFVFMDAVKVKSRVFVIVVGILFVLMNINNIYGNIFGDWNQGVVLFKYTIQGNEYTFMKRSTKRSIFLQIMLLYERHLYPIQRQETRTADLRHGEYLSRDRNGVERSGR